MGEIKAICISQKRGTQKSSVNTAVLKENWGIEGDAHADNWHRQVSLISADKIAEFKKRGADVSDGAFGENIIAEGIDFASLPVGTRLGCGNAVLELTQIGKECHSHCAIYHKVGDCIMPREGVFAKVIRGGEITVGDELKIIREGSDRLRAAVITLSDRCAQGLRQDESGALLKELLEEDGYEVIESAILPDEAPLLSQKLIRLCDMRQPNLILTTGGTGFNPRDITPEASLAVADRNASGIAEAIRAHSMKFTQHAMLSRGVSVIRKSTLIINFPGSPKACAQSWECVKGALPHALKLLGGGVFDCSTK